LPACKNVSREARGKPSSTASRPAARKPQQPSDAAALVEALVSFVETPPAAITVDQSSAARQVAALQLLNCCSRSAAGAGAISDRGVDGAVSRLCFADCTAQCLPIAAEMKRVEKSGASLSCRVAMARLIFTWSIHAPSVVALALHPPVPRILVAIGYGRMQQRVPASCGLARMNGYWYLSQDWKTAKPSCKKYKKSARPRMNPLPG